MVAGGSGSGLVGVGGAGLSGGDPAAVQRRQQQSHAHGHVARIGGQAGEGPNLIFAAIVLSVLIPFTVFVLAQKYFVESVASSGIK